MELLLLGGLGAAGYYLTQNNTRDFTRDETSLVDKYQMNWRDNMEAGLSLGTFRSQNLNMVKLNDAWKPRGPPSQKPTRNPNDVLRSKAEVDAYLEQNAYKWYFIERGDIPLSSAQQSNPNVEIPTDGVSIRWDRGNSLAHYPRVYADCLGKSNCLDHPFTGDPGTMGHGEPTEDEEREVPEEGRLNFNWNPWGPGGVVQRVMAHKGERRTKRRMCNQSTVTRPPYGSYYWSSLSGTRPPGIATQS